MEGPGGGLVLDVACGQGTKRSLSLTSGRVEESQIGERTGPVYLPGADTTWVPMRLSGLDERWVEEGALIDVALELQPGTGGSTLQASELIDNGEEHLSLRMT